MLRGNNDTYGHGENRVMKAYQRGRSWSPYHYLGELSFNSQSQDVPWNIEELAKMDCHSRDRGKFPNRITDEMRVVVCVIAL